MDSAQAKGHSWGSDVAAENTAVSSRASFLLYPSAKLSRSLPGSRSERTAQPVRPVPLQEHAAAIENAISAYTPAGAVDRPFFPCRDNRIPWVEAQKYRNGRTLHDRFQASREAYLHFDRPRECRSDALCCWVPDRQLVSGSLDGDGRQDEARGLIFRRKGGIETLRSE